MAIHSYNVEIAIEYGIEEAILIQHFAHWIGEHAANGIDLHEGRFWSYDKTDALYAILPEFKNKKKIEYFINKLVDKDILIKGNFNKVKFDRTLWYTFTDNGIRLIFEHGILTYECMVKIIEEVSKVSDFDFSKFGNGKPKNENTITHNNQPYNSSSNSPIINNSPITPTNTPFIPQGGKPKESGKTELDLSIVEPEFGNVVLKWLTYKKERKQTYKQMGFNSFYKKLIKLSGGDPNIADMIVEQSMANNYQGIFELKGGNYGNSTSRPTDSQALKAAIDQSWGPGGDPLADIL